MTDKLDMSLDDIIEQSKKHERSRYVPRGRGIRKPRGRGGPFPRRGGRGPVGAGQTFREPLLDARGKWKKDSAVRRRVGSNPRPSLLKPAPHTRSLQPPTIPQYRPPPVNKLFLSNLGYRVSQKDIIELFSQIGPLKNARVNYDKSGRSLGTGEVTFELPAHAAQAERTFNGILIDSKPLVIEKSGTSQTSQTGGSTKLSSGITVMLPQDLPEQEVEVEGRAGNTGDGLPPDVKTVHRTMKSAAVVATITPEEAAFPGSRLRSSIMRSSGLYSDQMDIS